MSKHTLKKVAAITSSGQSFIFPTIGESQDFERRNSDHIFIRYSLFTVDTYGKSYITPFCGHNPIADIRAFMGNN